MSATSHDRHGMTPALAGSAVLHVAVVAMFLISWPWARELKVGSVVPVKIVTNAPTTDVRPAIQAPEEQTAAAEAPVPNESLQAPAPPEPQPAPTPAPAPAPTPTPAPAKPAPPKPAPPKPAPPVPTPKPAPTVQKTPPAKPQPAASAAKPAPHKEVDLDKLLASVSKGGGRPAGPPRSSAARGPTRAETATQARPAVGAGLSANAISGLTEELQRRWNPNCEVEGGRDVQVRVVFTLGESGNVIGDVTAGGEERSPNSVVKAAAERAIRAVYAAAPFRTLPREFYGERIAVKFNAQEACS